MKAMVGMDLGEGKSGAGWGKACGGARFQFPLRHWKINWLCRLCKRIVQGQGGGGPPPAARRPPPCHKCIAVRRITEVIENERTVR